MFSIYQELDQDRKLELKNILENHRGTFKHNLKEILIYFKQDIQNQNECYKKIPYSLSFIFFKRMWSLTLVFEVDTKQDPNTVLVTGHFGITDLTTTENGNVKDQQFFLPITFSNIERTSSVSEKFLKSYTDYIQYKVLDICSEYIGANGLSDS